MKDTRVAIFGAGQIGRAVYKMLTDLTEQYVDKDTPYMNIEAFVIDSSESNIRELIYGTHLQDDLQVLSVDEITKILKEQEVTHVINAMPFSLNEKIASAAIAANCSYIDFTEDDVMADKVQKLFQGTDLDCAVKCGLAPGFINYIGYSLVDDMKTPDSLMISVGALPRNVLIDENHPESSYSLTWSVDGLVNEYTRPCRIRSNGELMEVPALSKIVKVIQDGVEFEAAYTSGGVGNLAHDLDKIPNVCYMTLRYPGHYKYIQEKVEETKGDFTKLRDIFSKKFPITTNDVIVVHAKAQSKDEGDVTEHRVYSNRFVGVDGLTAIQSTTAGSGVAILELMLEGKLSGIVNHKTVNLGEFMGTRAFGKYYKIGEKQSTSVYPMPYPAY